MFFYVFIIFEPKSGHGPRASLRFSHVLDFDIGAAQKKLVFSEKIYFFRKKHFVALKKHAEICFAGGTNCGARFVCQFLVVCFLGLGSDDHFQARFQSPNQHTAQPSNSAWRENGSKFNDQTCRALGSLASLKMTPLMVFCMESVEATKIPKST